MKHADSCSSDFILEGQFLGFVIKGSKIKSLRLVNGDSEQHIKLSRESRASVGGVLLPNDWIQVYGRRQCDRKTGTCQLKAYQIVKSDGVQSSPDSAEVYDLLLPDPVVASPTAPVASTFKILVCRKSGCQKKGGHKQHQRLEQILRDRQLNHHVILQEAGCLGKCSMAPNIMLMPGKKRLSGMSPEAIADFVERLITN